MIYGERPECRTLENDGKGLIGTIVVLCDWRDVDPAPIEGLPKCGDPWVSVDGVINPFLRCVHVSAREGASGECEWTADYSTQGQTVENYCEKSLDISLEPGPAMTGFTWKSTGTPATDIPARPIPTGVLNIKIRRDLPPYSTVFNAMDKVNDSEFLGYPAGCVLFLGATMDESSSLTGEVISAGVVYKFSVRTREHKYFYRPPLQARDADGELIFWHNISADKPFYTTDSTKIATPVWVNQVPDGSANLAGIGGWDEAEDDEGNPYFESIDMATVLDIPSGSA